MPRACASSNRASSRGLSIPADRSIAEARRSAAEREHRAASALTRRGASASAVTLERPAPLGRRPDRGRLHVFTDRANEGLEVFLEPRREIAGGAVIGLPVSPGLPGVEHLRAYAGHRFRNHQPEERVAAEPAAR